MFEVWGVRFDRRFARVGPTYKLLVEFHKADLAYMQVKMRLATVTRAVRQQQAKVDQLTADEKAEHEKLVKLTARAAELESDVKQRESHIEALRQRQQAVTTAKEYQALLVDINTHKLDKGKVEEQALVAMEAAETQKTTAQTISQKLEAEKEKLAAMLAEIDDRVKQLEAELAAAKAPRDELAARLPQAMLAIYERLSERMDGEAMVPIEQPDPRAEEYLCTGCNTYLVVDVYNRLRTRDELELCNVCGRVLYIPDDLTPEKAVVKTKAKKPTARKSKKKAAETAAPAGPSETPAS